MHENEAVSLNKFKIGFVSSDILVGYHEKKRPFPPFPAGADAYSRRPDDDDDDGGLHSPETPGRDHWVQHARTRAANRSTGFLFDSTAHYCFHFAFLKMLFNR